MSYETWFLLALCAYDAVGLCAGALLLWRAGRHRTAWWSDAVKLLALETALCVLAVLLGRAFTLHAGFAKLSFMAHSVVAVCAPLALLRGIWWLRRGGRAFAALLLAAGIAAEGVYLYASRWELTWLEVTRYEVSSPHLRAGDPPIRIAVLADLQTEAIGAYEERVFAELDALRADLVLLPGDFLQIIRGTAQEVEEQRLRLVALINGLRHAPRYGIAAVLGDVDSDPELFRGTAVRVVDDTVVRLDGDPPLQLIGLGRWASRAPLAPRHFAAARAFAGPTIVMGHAPDFAAAPAWRQVTTGRSGVDVPLLCVAGHTHGGQVVLPGFGPLITLSGVPRSHASGCHQLGAMTLFVSRGVGHECGLAPRVRFNCRPELALITLVPAARADPQEPRRR